MKWYIKFGALYWAGSGWSSDKRNALGEGRKNTGARDEIAKQCGLPVQALFCSLERTPCPSIPRIKSAQAEAVVSAKYRSCGNVAGTLAHGISIVKTASVTG